jgi:hypothetical protein
MTGWDAEAFFTLHAELPREGPGETADVAWAAEHGGNPGMRASSTPPAGPAAISARSCARPRRGT